MVGVEEHATGGVLSIKENKEGPPLFFLIFRATVFP